MREQDSGLVAVRVLAATAKRVCVRIMPRDSAAAVAGESSSASTPPRATEDEDHLLVRLHEASLRVRQRVHEAAVDIRAKLVARDRAIFLSCSFCAIVATVSFMALFLALGARSAVHRLGGHESSRARQQHKLDSQLQRLRRQNPYLGSIAASARTAMLVRGYKPSDSMLRRWALFAKSCRSVSPSILFSVSLDVTNRTDNATASDADRLRSVVQAGALVHEYTEADILAAFPGLRTLAAVYTGLTRRPYRYGRYAIIEPILLWHSWLLRLGGAGSSKGKGKGKGGGGGITLGGGVFARLKYFWILEQDVACSDAVHVARQLLLEYRHDPSDLLTALPMNETKFASKILNQGSAGLHAAVKTPSFGAAFPDQANQLRVAPVFVQRWSAAFAAELHSTIEARSMHGWAEIATPSLCRRAGLTIGSLQPQHRGALYHACCTRHVKTTSQNFLPDERRFMLRVDQTVVKLYHPVKF